MSIVNCSNLDRKQLITLLTVGLDLSDGIGAYICGVKIISYIDSRKRYLGVKTIKSKTRFLNGYEKNSFILFNKIHINNIQLPMQAKELGKISLRIPYLLRGKGIPKISYSGFTVYYKPGQEEDVKEIFLKKFGASWSLTHEILKPLERMRK